jgi:hypothetical protein
MLRSSALRVEVFIDVEDDGTRHAEAVLLRTDDRRLLATGHARCPSADTDEAVAAKALAELTANLRGSGRCSSDADDDGGGAGCPGSAA